MYEVGEHTKDVKNSKILIIQAPYIIRENKKVDL